MQTITPHLWFDKEAEEAAEFYTSLFDNSKIKDTTTLHNTPSGSVDLVAFDLSGQEFRAISAGPLFTFNPSVSFLVCCKTKREVDPLWKKLSKGGSVLMDLGTYPFSERYGWVQDRYGLSWQVMFMDGQPVTQKIIPVLMFVGKVCGRAEEAVKFYTSVFDGSGVNYTVLYDKGEAPGREGMVKHAGFTLLGTQFAAMDSAREHAFAFNEAISFMVHCDTQKEIDCYWGKLSADPKAEQCGWLKDKYGLSWQIVPAAMDEMLKGKDEKKIAQVTEAFLQMKKFDIDALTKAYEQG